MGTRDTYKMNTKHVRNAILNLLERELCLGGLTLDELGGKIYCILWCFPLTKKVKDKNAPKRPRTAYTFFCKKNRAETVESMGKDCSSTDVVCALAERWKELKFGCENGEEDAMNEMQEYKEESVVDKARYLAENAAYVNSLRSSSE